MVSKDSKKFGEWYLQKSKSGDKEFVKHYQALAKKYLTGKGGI